MELQVGIERKPEAVDEDLRPDPRRRCAPEGTAAPRSGIGEAPYPGARGHGA